MSTAENDSLSVRPHKQLAPELSWKINIPEEAIVENSSVKDFIEEDADQQHRLFTKEELARVLANADSINRKSKREPDFNRVINDAWSKNNRLSMKVPSPEITARMRTDQLIRMGVPSIKRTYYHRDFTEFCKDIHTSAEALNDTTGDPLGEYTAMVFKPIAVYTDYVGRLYNTSSDIMSVKPDISDEQLFEILSYCKSVDKRAEVNHISVVFENSVQSYYGYPQVSCNTPSEKDTSYIRFTLLLGGD